MTRPLRVAWLGHDSAKLGGGMATYSLETTRRLRERGLHVTFFHHGRNPLASRNEPEPPPTPDNEVALSAVPLMKPLVLSPPKSKRELVDRLRVGDFDLVHASFWFSSLDFDLPRQCRELGIPIVATFHVAFDTRMSLWGGITSATYRLYAPALSQCDRVIVFGDAQRDVLTHLGVPNAAIRVLPNGVDVDRYQPGPSGARESFGGSRYFVYMGRVDAEKNVDVLLRAFAAEAGERDVKLVVVGTGTAKRRLERQFRDPRIVFTGHIADASRRVDILRGADGFILPSSVEGLSLAMLEAMACGVPTIATDVGGDGEALRGAGIVIDPSNLEAELRVAMRTLADVPELGPVLAAASRRRAVERYGIDRNVDALVALYEDLVR